MSIFPDTIPHTAESLHQTDSKDPASVSLHLYSNLERESESGWTFTLLHLKVKSQRQSAEMNVNEKSSQGCRCFYGSVGVFANKGDNHTINFSLFHKLQEVRNDICCMRSSLNASQCKRRVHAGNKKCSFPFVIFPSCFLTPVSKTVWRNHLTRTGSSTTVLQSW